LKQWQKLRQTATRREMTGDRILLAEYFRRKVENFALEQTNEAPNSIQSASHSLRYPQYIQNMSGNNVVTCMGSGGIQQSGSDETDHSNASDNRPLRLVVISDTHGYEESLTPDGGMLPQGDILLHLGDFAIDSSMKKKAKAIENFDAWLARQPHRTKIVLRGNHDPFSVQFPLSGANYFSKPKSIAIDGKITVTLVPYTSPRNLSSSWRNLPMFCDILASHSPPHRVLDKCYNGVNAGCSSLRTKVERMVAGPPHLWLCGHIHEGRGAEKVAFGLSSRETMVVNVSNANDGRATHIQYDPVVLDIDTNGNINVVQGERIQPESTRQDQRLATVSVQ
jgi:Icc-related predicted phosphoesterase